MFLHEFISLSNIILHEEQLKTLFEPNLLLYHEQELHVLDV